MSLAFIIGLLYCSIVTSKLLLHCTCNYNSRYFFSGTVLLHMDSDESNGDPTVETEFFRIMEVQTTY